MREEVVSPEDINERLDVLSARLFGITRSQAQKAIQQGEICSMVSNLLLTIGSGPMIVSRWLSPKLGATTEF